MAVVLEHSDYRVRLGVYQLKNLEHQNISAAY